MRNCINVPKLNDSCNSTLIYNGSPKMQLDERIFEKTDASQENPEYEHNDAKLLRKNCQPFRKQQ